jgi:hypothetical protein
MAAHTYSNSISRVPAKNNPNIVMMQAAENWRIGHRGGGLDNMRQSYNLREP